MPTPVVLLLYDPKEKTTVCVKLLAARVMFTVTALVPSTLTEEVTLEIVLALAMVSNVPLPDAVTLP